MRSKVWATADVDLSGRGTSSTSRDFKAQLSRGIVDRLSRVAHGISDGSRSRLAP